MKTDLKGLNTLEMADWALSQGLETYRGRQIRHWILAKLAGSFEEMTNLPKSLRLSLKETATISHLNEIEVRVSEDGTKKYLFRLSDGHLIESVLIPERGHSTLCISSQVGCAMSCRFCHTARLGFKRNLTPSELIDQVIHVKRSIHESNQLTNIVLMGMGEPLANYDSVVKALRNLISEDGMNFSHRKVTISTCGLAPQITKLGKELSINLAISLNAADDATRSRLMPINRTYPLKALISACRNFPLPGRRMITFEYILIKGINDRVEDAMRLLDLLSGLRCKINLIPLNPYPDLDMHPPSTKKTLYFQKILLDNHFTAIIRKSKGSDIMAACGQLVGSQHLA